MSANFHVLTQTALGSFPACTADIQHCSCNYVLQASATPGEAEADLPRLAASSSQPAVQLPSKVLLTLTLLTLLSLPFTSSP